MVDSVNKSNLLRNTAIAAGIGAGVNAATCYVAERFFVINSKRFTPDMFKSSADACKAMQNSVKTPVLKQIVNGYAKYGAKISQMTADVIKTGKTNWKLIGIAGASGAIGLAGIYLAYRGIKSLFTK